MSFFRTHLHLNSLQSQLILAMIVVTVIPLITLTIGLYYLNFRPFLETFVDFNKNLLDRYLMLEQGAEAGRLADQIKAFFENVKLEGQIISRVWALKTLSTKEKINILYDYLQIMDDIDIIAVRNLNDRVRILSRNNQQISSELQGILSNQILFQRTLAGEIATTQPFLLPERKELAMIITLPIQTNTGQPLGCLSLQVNLKTIQQMTVASDKMNPGTMFVVDADGRLIGHKDKKRVLQQEDMTDLEIVKNFLIPRISSGTSSYINKHGIVVRGSSALVEGLNWGVISERSLENAMIPINQMVAHARFMMNRVAFATLLGSVSTMFLAALIGAFLALRISSPLKDIMTGVHAIAEGDFSRHFEPKGPLDIQQLSTTLNLMSEAISQYTKDLQQQAQNLRNLFVGSVESLAAAIDAKDPYTKGHSGRVTQISVMIGEQLGLTKDQIEELRVSALMHDVGKIGIDDAILKKPSTVTPEERKILEMHPVLGAKIMEPIPLLKNMIPGMLHHHERWDGSGYPDGLKGEEIPLYGRIIAVADTFDAMTSDRPYQKTYEMEEARDLIVSWKGTRYDPKVVDAFLAVFPEIRRYIQEAKVASS